MLKVKPGKALKNLFSCQESGEWSPVFGCHHLPKLGECCKELTFSAVEKDFLYSSYYSAFLGPWIQVITQFDTNACRSNKPPDKQNNQWKTCL